MNPSKSLLVVCYSKLILLENFDRFIVAINITTQHKKEDEVILENNASELYFEVDDIDDFIKLLENRSDIEYLHPVVEHSWGQRAVRFYDLDRHIIEVAEAIAMVVKRFIDSGLTIDETADRTGVEPRYIKSTLDQL